jgi:pectin methylesterase-like acyl-CoA thioesterase
MHSWRVARPAELRLEKLSFSSQESKMKTYSRMMKLALTLSLWCFLACTSGTAAQSTASPQSTPTPRVLQVGTFNGKVGKFFTIQDAVNRAMPGDWILVAPGDYKELGGVLITTPNVHLRGMDRNGVVVDGTMPGSPRCSPYLADQNIAAGALNGIEVLQVDGV